MDILQMIYKDKDLVTPTRSPKPISQVAENITVIDAEEIEAINAHTLTDILNYIPGVQLEIRGGPGSITFAHIQGSDFRHVLVMIDGVALNNLSDNFADIGSIPVQQIERVEIVKGPASSSWGSSLGGVINVISKSAADSRRFGGTASASIGERNTGDYRGEASGRVGALAYYLYTGKLLSDGLTTGSSFDGNNFYAKLHWSAGEKSGILLTLGYTGGTRGAGEIKDPAVDLSFRNDFERLITVGSIAGAFLACHWGEDDALEKLDAYLRTTSIAVASVIGGVLDPFESRLDKLAETYERDLYGQRSLGSLQGGPRLYLNATNLATGNMFFFATGGGKPAEMGEWELGAVPAPDFRLSRAVAASSAFPPAPTSHGIRSCSDLSWPIPFT